MKVKIYGSKIKCYFCRRDVATVAGPPEYVEIELASGKLVRVLSCYDCTDPWTSATTRP